MSKIRVYELSKKININSKEIIEKLKEMGVEVSSHMSAIEEKDAKAVENFFVKPAPKKEEKPVKKEAPVKKETVAEPKKQVNNTPKKEDRPAPKKEERPVNNNQPKKEDKGDNRNKQFNKPNFNDKNNKGGNNKPNFNDKNNKGGNNKDKNNNFNNKNNKNNNNKNNNKPGFNPKDKMKKQPEPAKKVDEVVEEEELKIKFIPETITVKELAEVLRVSGTELVKNLIHVTMSQTGGAGELANFIVGISFVVPAALIYKYHKSFVGAIVALAVGGTFMAISSCGINYYITIPFYDKNFMPIKEIIEWCASVNNHITDMRSLIIIGILPFNVIKVIIVSIITVLIYKRISPLLHR